MDSASNSAKILRAFAAQQKYYYVTPLDDNQWNERKVIRFGRPSRYRYGNATLRELEIELIDSNEKGYLIAKFETPSKIIFDTVVGVLTKEGLIGEDQDLEESQP